MGKVMFQFRHKGATPRLDQVSSRYGLSIEQLDADYGVIETDSLEGLHVVLVDEDAQGQIQAKLKERGEDSDPAVGVFSNPRIEPT
jgi:hypothetical protein